MSSNASYYFLPWVRYGLWKNIQEGTQVPELGKNTQPGDNPSIPGRAKIPIELKLSKNNVEQDIDGINLSLFGPGDIVGIDAREIVRTEPRHLTPDFLPNLFPFIEFDRPDFPWLFTPGKPDANDCLLPWIVLVVLPKEQATIITDPTKPSPELKCLLDELPDLKESWAWAHAQYIGLTNQSQEDIHAELAARPNQNVSRLICPRKLKPNEHYLACVVPAFKVIEITDQSGKVTSTLDLAWKHGDRDPNQTLPVYYQWEFSTATEGDFEDFITRLKKPGDLNEKAKESFSCRMDVSDLLTNTSETATLNIISALELPGLKTDSPEPSMDVIDNLIGKINDSQSPNDNVPLPIYGSGLVQNTQPDPIRLNDDKFKLPMWLTTLNKDPRYRVAAALGTQVIQRQQEQLMAAAWEQATGLDAVNQIIRQKQLGMNVSNSFFNRLEKLSDTAFLQVTEPVSEAVALAKKEKTQESTTALRGMKSTVQAGIVSLESKAVLSACCRRLLRPQSPLLRHGATSDKQQVQLKSYIKSRAVATAIFTGTLPPDSVLATSATPPNAEIAAVSPVTGSAIAGEVMALLQSAESESIRTPGMEAIRTERMSSLKPDQTFRDEMRARLDKKENGLQSKKPGTRQVEAPPSKEDDPLKVIENVALSFPQPMCEPLRDFFQEMLIPGLDQIPNNSLVVLKTNPAFIEAYMAGLNHEMGRELLWREYPTCPGDIYFQKFWDDRGSDSPVAGNFDIRSWQKELGKNTKPEKEDLWVLLIKGDLLTRYPNTIIYAQKTVESENKFPVLRVNPVPGVILLGFSIEEESEKTPDKISGDEPGWSFVLEENPTETRFGLNVSQAERPDSQKDALDSWRALRWDHVVLRSDGSGYIQLEPESDLKQEESDRAAPKYEALAKLSSDSTAKWVANSAHMAYITLQKPLRYIIPSSEWFS